MSELLVADEIDTREVEKGSLPNPTNDARAEFTIPTWISDEVGTPPEVAEVIAKLPWWAMRSLLYIILAFVLSALTWASVVKVDMVAVANGTLVPQGNVKPVQPASSGVVQNVFVKEGDQVAAGDALIQLDAAEMRTRMQKLRQELETNQSELRLMMVSRPTGDTLEQQNKISRLQTEITATEKMLQHTTITAPASGIITTFKVKGVGEVLQLGETIATIAPGDVPLVVEALLPNKDVAFIERGLPAKLKFEAFPFQDYGVVEGTVIEVSPDSINGKDNVAYYKVTIALNRSHISTNEGQIRLRAGLSVSAEIVTEQRSVLNLLFEPARKFKREIAG